jgi:hypothetical protein
MFFPTRFEVSNSRCPKHEFGLLERMIRVDGYWESTGEFWCTFCLRDLWKLSRGARDDVFRTNY